MSCYRKSFEIACILSHQQVLREASANFDEAARYRPQPQQQPRQVSPAQSSMTSRDRLHPPFPVSFEERISSQSMSDDAMTSASRRSVTSQRKLQMNDPWKPMTSPTRTRSAQNTTDTVAQSSSENRSHHKDETTSRDVTSASAADVIPGSTCAVVGHDSNVRFSMTQAAAPAADDDAAAECDDVTTNETRA